MAPHLPGDLNPLGWEPCFVQSCTLCSYAVARVFTFCFCQFIGLDEIELLAEQLHRVTNVTFQAWRLLTLSHFDADIFWHVA